MFKDKKEFCQIFEKKLIEKYGRSLCDAHLDEYYDILGTMIREYSSLKWKHTKDEIEKKQVKQVVYFSMEFLIGKLLKNNLYDLGIYDVVKDGLKDLNINLEDLIDTEKEAGLGNGGLGRLAACYMDSIAACGYAGHGNSIRYEFGFFKQVIDNKKQVEVPDQWLKNGNVWEVKKPHRKIDITFYGNVESFYENGRNYYRLTNAEHVNAVPYDVPMIGYKNGIVNTLRLWSAEPSDELLPKDKDFYTYLNEVKQLCYGLYPDDSTEQGKILRLKQQYFFVSAGIKTNINYYMKTHNNLDDFPLHYVFQLNDTHPVLGIPEFMRLLLDEYNYEWDDAWKIVTSTFAYTNHTIMSEALEKWPTHYIKNLLPRVYTIIEEINRRFSNYVRQKTNSDDIVKDTLIIKDGLVYMTNLAIVGSYSVNGVATLHSEILKNQVLKRFYQIFPNKFTNVTNGISHRRFLAFSNPQLSDLIADYIGKDWIKEPAKLEQLSYHIDDQEVIKRFLSVKEERKKILAKYIKEHNNIEVDINSIFDIQVKRLHAYKRQMLNIFHIIYLYQEIKSNPEFKMIPRTFIFGAKAAPSYAFAKKVIELICHIAEKVNNDKDISKWFKVIFIENYNVTKAEIIMPACDVSEQISLSGKEASGTGNMKFMMNGALTLGTMDGANVEICNLVGKENIIIFGMHDDDVVKLRNSGKYDAKEIYKSNQVINKIMNSLIDGTFCTEKEKFSLIFNEILLKNDEYFLFEDFKDYIDSQQKIDYLYLEKEKWAKMCLTNIAKSGYFSSDRSINDYVEKIWNLTKI
ncbi:MAG: glycogen/starch/alpha-glucan phosphorylase [Bacilli bacterium]|nr:glycogen/starch/alpha-glucan phosphorylase [Bacilli bacterium]